MFWSPVLMARAYFAEAKKERQRISSSKQNISYSKCTAGMSADDILDLVFVDQVEETGLILPARWKKAVL